MTDDLRNPHLPPPAEPSILDFIKAKLSFGRRPAIELPTPEEQEPFPRIAAADGAAPGMRPALIWGLFSSVPWRSLLALTLALFAQALLEPPGRSGTAGSIAYALALSMLAWAALGGEWALAPHRAQSAGTDAFKYRQVAFLVSLPISLIAFLSLSGNLFTGFNVLLWLTALGAFVWSLWLRRPGQRSLLQRLGEILSRPSWELRFHRGTLVVLAVTLLVIFFRVYHLQQTPAEPFSDHAEKLLDVYDVSRGQAHIFFTRNTGREGLQMYWTLLMAWIFGTGFSFLSLKIGTILIGLLTLPYIYLLGREVAGRRVGLLALILAGIGYWPNVIARVGLRFPLYPMFVAPLLLHLIRGLRSRNRNDFILAGIFLGFGLHGYSPYRIVPLLVAAAFVLYLLHAQSRGARQAALLWLVIVGLTSLIVFLPLLRYATENPDSFSYRAMTRLAGIEQPLAGPWYQVFLSNTWRALTLFNWDNGGIWVHSLPDRPALDVVTGALFLIGILLLLVRYGRDRDWLDLFLVASVPILLLPSILSLAFPEENPSLNRTAGAMVPAFLIAALALDGFISACAAATKRRALGYAITGALLWASASQNFDLVFRQYDQNFRNNSWNSSEIGAVIKQFGTAFGETETAWVVPFPHWVDTRLVGVWAGIPNRDFGLWTEQLPQTSQVAGPKLFMARASLDNPDLNDQAAVDALRALYPYGSLSLHRSPVPGHDFWIYFVPALSTP